MPSRSSLAPLTLSALLATSTGCSRTRAEKDLGQGARSLSKSVASASMPAGHPPVGETPTTANAGDAASTATRRASDLPSWACGEQLFANDFRGTKVLDDRAARKRGAARSADLLGKTLPPFVKISDAVAWTEHPRPQTVDQVTARRWPGPLERWVVTVTGKAEITVGAPLLDVRIAVIEVTAAASGAPASVRRVARTRAPVVSRAAWDSLPEDLRPTFACDNDGCDGDVSPRGFEESTSLSGLDFAHYDLADRDRAFGVNTRTTEGYAGGGGSFEVLTLYRVIGEDLVPVLAVPMSVQKLLAGDWQEDGSRLHESIDADLVLEVKPVDGGLAELLWHSKLSRHSIAYAWNEARRQYGCAPSGKK